MPYTDSDFIYIQPMSQRRSPRYPQNRGNLLYHSALIIHMIFKPIALRQRGTIRTMSDVLRRHIEKRVALTQNEYDRCMRFFTVKKLKKRQFLLQEGDICRSIAFVTNGCLREYTIDHKGEEHILQFAIRDWWISDLNSFLTGTPSVHYIDAVHDSEVLLLEKSSRDDLFSAVPKMERFFRLLLETNYISTHRRIIESLSASAEERYLIFIKTYPALVEKVPQSQIASYLGITPQSLSRIRKDLTPKR
jgi:CRP-like cAMP-binding protein